MSSSERVRSSANKKGSTAVLLSVTFVIMMAAVTAAIIVSRRMVVYSECKVFGEVWTKAVLSEYDIHLFEVYGLLAFHGPDSEVDKKLAFYLEYSTEGKLDADMQRVTSELGGFEMNNPDNFRKALKTAMPAALLGDLINGEPRMKRTDEEGEAAVENRYIANKVVIDTLPSRRMGNSFDISAIGELLQNSSLEDFIRQNAGGSIAELCFIRKNMNSHLAVANDMPAFYTNEWEYIANGSLNDDENLRSCRRKLFLLRNALNLAYLYSDPEKQAVIMSISEIISPGAGGLLLKLLINETWAAIESEYDVEALMKGGRVPLVKTAATWHTSIDAVLNGDDLKQGLDDEEKDLLQENLEDIGTLGSVIETAKEINEGQTYEDYLLILISAMNENTRLLRIMDIVQIDMKYRYYSDFDLQEYYCGVGFTIKANGKEYAFEETYK